MNLSEGRDAPWLAGLLDRFDTAVDLHTDADHHRSVLTMLGAPAHLIDQVLELAAVSVEHLDLRIHAGVHPRIGVLDVVPFVPLGTATLGQAALLRDATARRLANELGLPCHLYGPLAEGERTLPEIRRGIGGDLTPAFGPAQADPRSGAVAVGAREVMVAWNLWLAHTSLPRAQAMAAAIRGPKVRALGFAVEGAVQVSCNLLAPASVTCAQVAEQVADLLGDEEEILRAELIGLAPSAMLDAIEPARWAALDLDPSRTIEAAAERLGLSIA